MKPDNQARDFRKHIDASGVAPEDYVEMKCFVDLFEANPSLKLTSCCLTTSAPLILSSASLKPILQAHGRVRVFIFLLSGLFCCLGFSGVIFLLFGRGPRPRPNSKKKHAPAQTAKKKTRPRPFRACFFFFLLFGRVGVFVFCCLGGGRVFFCCLGGGRVLFFAVWAGACSFFAVWAGACSFFAVWAGGVFFFVFFLFGRGTGVHSLTHLPGSSLSDPTTKETEQQTKNTGSLTGGMHVMSKEEEEAHETQARKHRIRCPCWLIQIYEAGIAQQKPCIDAGRVWVRVLVLVPMK